MRRRLLLARAFGLGAALGLCAACTSTTVRRADREERVTRANVTQLLWRTKVHEYGLFEPRPEECASAALVGDRLVTGSRSGNVVALSAKNGTQLWSTAMSGGSDSEARFDEAHGQVYVGTDDGSLYAVDPASGKVRWTHRGRGAVERPVELGGEAIYVSTAADRVYALDAATGKYRWQYEREPPEGFTIHGHAGPRLSGDVLYAGFSDGYLVALRASAGEVMWARSLAAASEQFVDVDATPVLHDGLVLASSYSGGLFALRAEDGERAWRLGIEGASAVRLVGDRLYVAAPRDGLAALTPKGQVLWRQGLAEAGDLTAPQAAGPYLVFTGSRAGLFVIDRATGRLLETFNPGRGMCAAPTLSPDGRTLYVLANSGTLYALGMIF